MKNLRSTMILTKKIKMFYELLGVICISANISYLQCRLVAAELEVASAYCHGFVVGVGVVVTLHAEVFLAKDGPDQPYLKTIILKRSLSCILMNN